MSEIGIARGWPFHLADERGSQGVRGGLVTAGFLRALQVRPTLGRIFTWSNRAALRVELVPMLAKYLGD